MKIFTWLKKLFKVKAQKGYVSPIDQFLKEFDQKHPNKSASQMAEKAKFQRIFYRRDNQ